MPTIAELLATAAQYRRDASELVLAANDLADQANASKDRQTRRNLRAAIGQYSRAAEACRQRASRAERLANFLATRDTSTALSQRLGTDHTGRAVDTAYVSPLALVG